MRNKAGAAKIIGTLMSFAGVMLLTLYKGVALTHQVEPSESPDQQHAGKKSWTLGTLALLANCLCFSFWLLLQSKLTKKYPALYSSTAYMFLISSLQGGSLTAAIQRRASVWILTRPLEIVTVLYTVWLHIALHIPLVTFCWYLYTASVPVDKKSPLIDNSTTLKK
jgi:drug/metabolite transporter (DMT)-like permease